MAATISIPLPRVPLGAQTTAAAGTGSLPHLSVGRSPVGPSQSPPAGDGSDRTDLGFPDPAISLVGPSPQFLRGLNGSMGARPALQKERYAGMTHSYARSERIRTRTDQIRPVFREHGTEAIREAAERERVGSVTRVAGCSIPNASR